MIRHTLLCAIGLACLAGIYAQEQNGDQCILSKELSAEIHSYQDIVNKIFDEALHGSFAGTTWESLSEFTDKFGGRLTGSRNLELATNFMLLKMEEAGLDNVQTEIATIPKWTRGVENATLITPRLKHLNILGLGGNVGTPAGGIIAKVIVVDSLDEFDKLPDRVIQGNIVLFNPKWESYAKTSLYRLRGGKSAAEKGAVAALIKSITPFSLNTPHTGDQTYEGNWPRIPVASVTVEDAELLSRLYHRGETVSIHLELNDGIVGPYISRNVIAEYEGASKPSAVIVSAHIDSWDVGEGALDDGGGCYASWKAVQLLKQLEIPRPKRSVRVVLFTGEEQGLWGAKAYQKSHVPHEEVEFDFFMESDFGIFEPRGFSFTGNNEAQCIFREILKLMAPLNATDFSTPAQYASDIGLWLDRGFPGATLLSKSENYFWYHHSDADSITHVDSVDLDKTVALHAAIAYIIADLSIDMPKNVLPLK